MGETNSIYIYIYTYTCRCFSCLLFFRMNPLGETILDNTIKPTIITTTKTATMVDGEHMWETLFSIIYICCWRVNPFGRIRFQRDWEKLESGNCIMLAGEPIGRNHVQQMYHSLGERTHWKKQLSSIPMMCWADYHIGENHFQTMTRS